MCTGAELALVAGGLSAAGTVIGVQQQQELANFQAEQASANAETEQQAGEIRAEKTRERARKVAAAARASLAASGIDIGSPSAELINKDILERGEQDAFTQTSDASDRASRLRQQADVFSLRGRQAPLVGALQIGQSAISLAGTQGAWGSTAG